MYHKNLDAFKDPIDDDKLGVRTDPYEKRAYFYTRTEWGSPNHIHMLMVVKQLIMKDARKMLGNKWRNENYIREEDDDTKD